MPPYHEVPHSQRKLISQYYHDEKVGGGPLRKWRSGSSRYKDSCFLHLASVKGEDLNEKLITTSR